MAVGVADDGFRLFAPLTGAVVPEGKK